ncbi:hypothetical protein AB1Y20_008990 [Prymnesium parvum]|uniref:Uncharacterized protein n=1 Tax=Prymnesium parvum TaxID=97485 RepID=A0AB34K5D9_PRYPA
MAADALYAGYHGWRCPALRLQRLKMPCASTATAGATLDASGDCPLVGLCDPFRCQLLLGVVQRDFGGLGGGLLLLLGRRAAATAAHPPRVRWMHNATATAAHRTTYK